MPRQVLELIDYFAPFAALLMFAFAIVFFAFFLVNFYYISDRDSLTVFEKFGAQFDICLGPHSMSDIYRGGPKSQFDLQKVEPEESVVVQRAGRSSEMRGKF
uniref:Uncharacterized protein n=3 Tax=Meloidogyne TaxID=189290 RepID=A0A6V7UAL4_MELEN|nr:unnamed protein product [Meloidogyne enterolobii]